MRIFDHAPAARLEGLRQILAHISAEEAAANEMRQRAMALQARIDQAEETAQQLQSKIVADPYQGIDRGGLAERVLAGETITDGLEEARARGHHNSIVSNEIQRQRDLASSMREDQHQLERDASSAREHAIDLMNHFRRVLLGVAFDAAEDAVRDLIRDFLLPLYVVRSRCQLGKGPIDQRIGVIFDHAQLWTLNGNSIIRQWPPHEGLVIPFFEKPDPGAVEREMIAALLGAPVQAVAKEEAPE